MRVETDELWALEEPGEGWIALDRKLGSALTKIAKGEIGRELQQYQTTTLNNSQVVRGRVLLAMVFRYYASSSTGQVMYDMNHLQTLKLHSDNLEGFHNTWNMVLAELQTVPDKSLLQFWYFKQMQYFKPMAEDIAHYKRAQYLKSPDYSFDWLWNASCRYLTMKREDHMQHELNRSLRGDHPKAVPGLSAKGSKNKEKGGMGKW